ncbi:MAG: N-acyl homoserine lactone hydrolase [Solirubrobacteraceae bacterium]|jgi:glyoxylase-like metal-dependent hydrolase (beta-lactamase superfamily II)|nr:N-acyl homoserine lactone hydrolase [Solirubrobacteraceae bacterium]
MRIHPIRTGQVRIRERMRRGVPGPARRAALVTGPWTEPLPVLAWAIEHPEGLIVVDTGERAGVRDAPFARFDLSPEEELGPGLRAAGLDPADVRTVVLTHLHGDHMNGLGHLPGARVLVSAAEVRAAATPLARVIQRVTHQPLPEPFDPVELTFDGPPAGAFARSHALTAAADVLVVPTPGHTPGHSSVLVVEGELHRLIAGDASYDEAQLLARHVDAVSPSAKVALATMDTILRHAALHPTVYLPSHDPASAARLAGDAVLRPAAAA